MPSVVRKELDGMLNKAKRLKAGLCISVIEAKANTEAGRAHRDLFWMASCLVATI